MKTLNLFILLVFIFLGILSASGYSFEVDGIYYKINSDGQSVNVTFKDSQNLHNTYSGNIVIPESITYNDCTYTVVAIGENAFFDCDSLLSIDIPNSVTTIGPNAFKWCEMLESVTFGNSLISINNDAFYNCPKLTSIELPNTLISIGEDAFSNSGLIRINIPRSVTTIGPYAFHSCFNLIEVNLPTSITSIPYMGFGYCGKLTHISLPNSVVGIASSAFQGCYELVDIDIPNSVTTIGFNAFEYTSWYNKQEDGLIYAGRVVYKYKGAMPDDTSLQLEEGTSGIAEKAFYRCYGLESITLPNTVKNIGQAAFYQCSNLVKVNVPDSVQTIYDATFRECSKLSQVSLGKSLTHIWDRPFKSCYALRNITCRAENPPTIHDLYAFETSCYNNAELKVPIKSISKYRTANNWKKFVNIIGFDFPIGDVNEDSEINIADINAVINMILSSSPHNNGDVNEDGEVNIADINAIIDKILN